jgi:hypothetical protein
MAYQVPPDFTPFDVLTAAELDILSGNDIFFYDYMGEGDNAIQQIQYQEVTATSSGTTQMPCDDTIPQNTEGDEYLTKAITPKSATNLLVIEASLMIGFNASVSVENQTVALFQDSIANALAATANWFQTSGSTQTIPLRHVVVAGSTSARTYKIRSGNHNAGTTRLNGTAGSRRFGGVAASTLKITEYKV